MAFAGAVLCSVAGGSPPAGAASPPSWRFFGNDIANTRGQISTSYDSTNAATQINTRNAPKLAEKWSYSTVGDVSATPTVEAGGVYFPDYAGYLYKLDPATGALIWSKSLSSYIGAYGFSRSSPAIGAVGEIIIGDNSQNAGSTPGARVISVNRSTGAANWVAIVDSNPHGFVSTSPVIYNGRIYIGTASLEESLSATTPGFVATFRGSVVCLDEATGTILWQFYTAPQGYTGASVWGSNPVISTANHSLLVGTGNNYSVPASVAQCYSAAGASQSSQYACMDPTNYVDSILSLDLVSGKLNWSRRFGGADTWNVACAKGPQSACPTPAGLDDDFASAPNLAYVANFAGVPDDRGGTSNGYLLGAGQKSGVYWALDPANGGLFWSTYIGRGQIMWGSAVNTDDHNAVYVALSNNAHYTNTLAGRNGHAASGNGGAWAGLDLLTGKMLWQVPAYGSDIANPKVGGAAPGPVTFTNRVVFAGSTSGYFVALSAASGLLLWTYNAGGSVIGGPSVYNETLFWGAGANKAGPASVHKVFAFSVGGT